MPLNSLMSYLTGIDPNEARAEAVVKMKKECGKNVRQHRKLRKSMGKTEDPITAIVNSLHEDGRSK